MSTPPPLPEDWKDVQAILLPEYKNSGLWGETEFAAALPPGLEEGSDPHLAYLTLVYTISGGRDPGPLWEAARQTYMADPELFDPAYLAYAKPKDLQPRLKNNSLSKKKSEATVWQRIGKALVMRAGGYVQKLLADNDFDAENLLTMLQKSKTTFPVLSGEQTAPRWIYALAAFGKQPIKGAEVLFVQVSPSIAQALDGLDIVSEEIPVHLFDALDALGGSGCDKRKPHELLCPLLSECVVAHLCRYGVAAS